MCIRDSTVSELDTMMSVLVDSKGYFEIEDMPADYWYNFKTVSYTHLTLPTSDLV